MKFIPSIFALALIVSCSTGNGNSALLAGKISVSGEAVYYKDQIGNLMSDSLAAVKMTNWRQFRKSYMFCQTAYPEQFKIPDKAAKGLMFAQRSHDDSKAAKYAEEILEYNYTYLYAHYELANNMSVSNSVREFHEAVYEALIASIMESGDGRSMETAMNVISKSEEYDILHHLGLRRVDYSQVSDDGYVYDVLVTQNGGFENVTLFFIVSEF